MVLEPRHFISTLMAETIYTLVHEKTRQIFEGTSKEGPNRKKRLIPLLEKVNSFIGFDGLFTEENVENINIRKRFLFYAASFLVGSCFSRRQSWLDLIPETLEDFKYDIGVIIQRYHTDKKLGTSRFNEIFPAFSALRNVFDSFAAILPQHSENFYKISKCMTVLEHFQFFEYVHPKHKVWEELLTDVEPEILNTSEILRQNKEGHFYTLEAMERQTDFICRSRLKHKNLNLTIDHVLGYMIKPEISHVRASVGADSTRKKHNEIVMDTHTNFVKEKMSHTATGITFDGTTFSKGEKPKIENFLCCTYDPVSSVNLVSVGEPFFYTKVKGNGENLGQAAIEEYTKLGALPNLVTIILDMASDGSKAAGIIISNALVKSKLVGHACGPAHNAHNVALYAGGKVLGQAAPFFPLKNGQETMKIGSKNLNLAATLCSDLGANEMYGPQSDMLAELRRAAPLEKRKLINFSSTLNGRFLDYEVGLRAMTSFPECMPIMACQLLQAHKTGRKSSKKCNYSINKKVWGTHLLNVAVQVGIYVEAIPVRRLKKFERFLHELPFSQSMYTDEMMGVVAFMTVMKELGQNKLDEMGDVRLERAARLHSANFKLRKTIFERNSCQARHTSSSHLNFYKRCTGQKKTDPSWSYQLCEECFRPELLSKPHPYWRGPKFSPVIEKMLPSWFKPVLAEKKKIEKIVFEKSLNDILQFLKVQEENEKDSIADLFWYMTTLHGEWSVQKYITQNLEYLCHPHFLSIGLLGPLSPQIAKSLIENVDQTLEIARKFFNSVNRKAQQFKNIAAVKEAIKSIDYKGPLKMLLDKEMLKILSILSKEKNCTTVFKHPDFVQFILSSICFENDIDIENVNKYVKSYAYQLLCRKATSDTIWTRLRIYLKNRMVFPDVVKSQHFIAEVLRNQDLTTKQKKEQKKIFVESQQTKESLKNPYSNLIPPLTRPQAKSVIIKRNHNYKKSEATKLAEKQIIPYPHLSHLKNKIKVSQDPQNRILPYEKSSYGGKPRKKRMGPPKKKKRKLPPLENPKNKRIKINIAKAKIKLIPDKFFPSSAIPPPPKPNQQRQQKLKQLITPTKLNNPFSRAAAGKKRPKRRASSGLTNLLKQKMKFL